MNTRVRGVRPFFLRTEMDVLLFLSVLFSCLLVIARVIHTGRLTRCGLLWNLFLAYIPYFITDCLARKPQWVSNKPIFAFFFVLWLLFIPNSFYIITDLFHLADQPGGGRIVEHIVRHSPSSIDNETLTFGAMSGYNYRQTPMWFDLALIFSCAWNGLLLGVLSVRRMEKLLLPEAALSGERPFLPGASSGRRVRFRLPGVSFRRRVNAFLPGVALRRELLFLFPIMWLNALGVYIGRYLRYNSWDVVSDPFELLGDIVRMTIHPLRYQYAWNMIFCFSILMTLMYLLLTRVSKALNS